MNKEQIIDEAYETYNKEIIRQREIQKEEVNRLRSQGKRVRVSLIELLSKESFINKCKTDTEFSEKWGLKIEERELSVIERIVIAETNTEVIPGFDSHFDTDEDVHKVLDTWDVPTKLITITYKDTTIESYE